MAIMPPRTFQGYAFDGEAGPIGIAGRRGLKGKGKKKPVITRHVTPPEDTDEGILDQSTQPTPPVPPLRTIWPQAQPDPINQAPKEDDAELPDELMQAGDVEPNPGPLLHCPRSPYMSWKIIACGDVEPNSGPISFSNVNHMLLQLVPEEQTALSYGQKWRAWRFYMTNCNR